MPDRRARCDGVDERAERTRPPFEAGTSWTEHDGASTAADAARSGGGRCGVSSSRRRLEGGSGCPDCTPHCRSCTAGTANRRCVADRDPVPGRGVGRVSSPHVAGAPARDRSAAIGHQLDGKDARGQRPGGVRQRAAQPAPPPGRSPGVLNAQVSHRFQYIAPPDDRSGGVRSPTPCALRYHPLAELRVARRPYDVGRLGKYWSQFTVGRIRGRRALLDDPYALFSSRWMCEQMGVRTLVLVRDPVGLIGSWKTLGLEDRSDAN